MAKLEKRGQIYGTGLRHKGGNWLTASLAIRQNPTIAERRQCTRVEFHGIPPVQFPGIAPYKLDDWARIMLATGA
jgi:hypothetical protein